jgi:hypothetical protein
MYREGTIWGKGSAELVLPISDQIDELDDQIMRNARLSGNPQREVSNQTGVDIEKITNEPGLIIPTNQTNGVKWIEPPSLPAYIITKRNDLMTNDRFIVSRFSDQMVGKNQSGVTTASQALALQQAGNTGIEHKKGMLQETLSDVFEYAIELGLLNWNTTMLFRITSENGERDFDSFNPDSLNNIPLLIESDGEYRKKFKEKNPEAKPEDYAYMQVKDETRKVKYDLKVTVGAGMPNNKAFRYQLMLESKEKQIISKKECRKYLRENLGLNVPAVPESMQEQQEIGIYDDSQILASNEMNQGIMPASVGTSNLAQNSSDIAGLNANNNVSLNSVKKGVM